MNKLVKRGISAYKIFLKNKIAMALMMLFSGVMMLIAALNGKGNDTKTMPLAITIAGIVFSFWSFYRLGYLKATQKHLENREEKACSRKIFFLQIAESLLYVAIVFVGIFLLMNESFMDKVLNLMCGGFTILNGVMGSIKIYKNRKNIDFQIKFVIVLTILEFAAGIFFVFAPELNMTCYIIMGIITSVAGIVETINAFTMDNVKTTLQDGKDIVHIMKDGE